MNIYVGNISYQTKEEDLVDLFSGMGAVDSARIIKDRETGRSKGFGFVEMPNVNEAKPREEKSGGFNRGGGSRGGFGGGNKRY